jgi:hypothetical protein
VSIRGWKASQFEVTVSKGSSTALQGIAEVLVGEELARWGLLRQASHYDMKQVCSAWEEVVRVKAGSWLL